MKTPILVLFPFLVLGLSCAWGADGAPPAVSSDYGADKLELNFKAGKIDVKNAELKVEGDYARDSQGRNGVSAQLDAGKKYLVNGEANSHHNFAVLMLKPSVEGRVDAALTSSPSLERVEAQVGGATFVHLQSFSGNESDKAANARVAYQVDLSKKYDELQAARRRLDDLKYCLRAESYCDNEADKTARQNDTLGRVVDEAATNANEKQRAYFDLRSRIVAAGYEMLDESSGAGVVLEKADVPYATAEANLVSVSGVYRDLRDFGSRQIGARFAAGEGAFHVAGNLNGVGLDLCGAITPIAAIAGRSENRGFLESAGRLCVGVQLGPVGHLTNEVAIQTDWNGYFKVSDTTSLKNIASSPISIGHTYENEWTASGDRIERNMIGMQVAY